MASVNPRASGLWEDLNMDRLYHAGDGDANGIEYQASQFPGSPGLDGRTPLDRTIDRIGMGSYQWTLLSLCGFGWLADNMWLQAIAIILPRIQQQFSIPDNHIGVVSASMFAGMMIGAVGWGTCSDLMGRSTAFNGTLCLTALFGLLSSFANSYTTMCIALFLLGSSVGGSMPTDGTLILESVPKGKQYLVTALSAFFSVGSVLAAVVALFVLPNNSCPVDIHPCDVDVQNRGWKYLLICLGLVTFIMFLARIVFFRLYESPRYLVHAGRPHDAVKSLQMISKFNGSELPIELEDVRDHHYPSELGVTDVERSFSDNSTRPRATSTTIFDATVIEDRGQVPNNDGINSGLVTAYASTGETYGLESHNFSPPFSRTPSSISITSAQKDAIMEDFSSVDQSLLPGPDGEVVIRDHSRYSSTTSRRSPKFEQRMHRMLPKWLRRPLMGWWDRVEMVLAPEWLETTLLVWSTWCAMALAYTMFNVYLPKLLETRKGQDKPQTLQESLWEVLLFTLGGCPGSFLGAFLIESNLGRKWSLAGTTFTTGLFCILFARMTSTWAVRVSTIGFNLSSTAMWAILYGWTPDIFGTKVRGTACGIASALSRIGGMIAPILGGILLTMERSIPVYTSTVVFGIAGFCVLLLKDRPSGRKSPAH